MAKEHWLVEYIRKVNNSFDGSEVYFLENPAENALLNDLEHYPHAFVLACCMEFTVDELASIPLEEYQLIFRENSLHRFNDAMAEIFYKAVWRLKTQYGGDASRIWSNNPSSAAVVYRFLEFDGVGVKIATMAANILARQFKVPFSDYYSIDISPDVHVFRVFRRTGLTKSDATRDAVIYKARELCPEFPGITDAACWRIGRGFCHASSPDCDHCPVTEYCPKLIDPSEE